jgi:hypothetical protein
MCTNLIHLRRNFVIIASVEVKKHTKTKEASYKLPYLHLWPQFLSVVFDQDQVIGLKRVSFASNLLYILFAPPAMESCCEIEWYSNDMLYNGHKNELILLEVF